MSSGSGEVIGFQHKEEEKYWEGVQRDQEDYTQYVNQLSQKKARETVQISRIQIDKKRTKELISEANQAYHTEINDLLLTALSYALSGWNKREVNHITLEGHGREHIEEDIDLTRLTFPVRGERRGFKAKHKKDKREFKEDTE
jgi:hypothetical protein